MEYTYLKDICDVRDGTHDSPKYVTDGYPLVTSKNIVKGCLDLSVVNLISKEDFDKINQRSKIDKGDIIMPMIGTIGNPFIINDFCEFAIKNVALIKFPNKNISNRFIYHYLNSNEFKQYINENSKGGTQKFLSLGDIRNFKIPKLELNNQIDIVKKLDLIKQLIDDKNKELVLLYELVKSRFIELFGDPEKNTKGWKISKLSEHLDVIGGYAFKSNLFAESGDIPVLRIGNINSGYFKRTNMVYWHDDEKLDRYAIYPGDLVMSLTGTVEKDDYGNVCILSNDFEKYYLNQRNAKLDLKNTVTKEYLMYLLKFPEIKKKLIGASRGVRQANISNKDILNLEVPIADIYLQNQFAQFVEKVDKSKIVIQQSLDKYQQLFDSLMQEYFG